jgi:hypothetical protein
MASRTLVGFRGRSGYGHLRKGSSIFELAREPGGAHPLESERQAGSGKEGIPADGQVFSKYLRPRRFNDAHPARACRL